MRISGAERSWALLGYLPLLCFLPVKLKKDSMFVQFHSRQGSVLFGLWVVLCIVGFVTLFFVEATLGQMVVFGILALGTLLYVVMAAIGILKSSILGERYRMPVVADVALMLNL